jgi:hypothetical protein
MHKSKLLTKHAVKKEKPDFYQAFFIGSRQTKQLALIHFVNTIARVKNTNITVDTVIM